MKFYDCKTAPSPRRARMFIVEKGLNIPTIEVDLRNKQQLTPEFLAINPHATVPVLELDDGTRFLNTSGIWRYLEAAYPNPPLLGIDAKEKGFVGQWQWYIETNGFLPISECLRNSAPGMKGRAITGTKSYEQIPELAERGRARVRAFLDSVDGFIGDKPFFCGDRMTVCDIDAFIAVEFSGWVKEALPEGATKAKAWFERIKARPSAQA